MTTMPKYPCPVCEKQIAVTNGGTLRHHNSRGPVGMKCSGSFRRVCAPLEGEARNTRTTGQHWREANSNDGKLKPLSTKSTAIHKRLGGIGQGVLCDAIPTLALDDIENVNCEACCKRYALLVLLGVTSSV